MSEEETESLKTFEYVKELAIQLQKNPSDRGRIIKLLAGNKTSDIARILSQRTQQMPYYRAHFAEEAKFVFDRMIQSGKTQEWRYADFPRLSKTSLKLKVYQSFLWLIDHADEDGRYITLRQNIEIHTRSPSGVRAEFLNKDFKSLNNAKEIDGAEAPVLPLWRTKMNKFIAEGVIGEKLVIDRIKLTEEEVKELSSETSHLINAHGVYAKFSSERILLVKPRPEDLAALK